MMNNNRQMLQKGQNLEIYKIVVLKNKMENEKLGSLMIDDEKGNIVNEKIVLTKKINISLMQREGLKGTRQMVGRVRKERVASLSG